MAPAGVDFHPVFQTRGAGPRPAAVGIRPRIWHTAAGLFLEQSGSRVPAKLLARLVATVS
jgi:hypothetical protein